DGGFRFLLAHTLGNDFILFPVIAGVGRLSGRKHENWFLRSPRHPAGRPGAGPGAGACASAAPCRSHAGRRGPRSPFITRNGHEPGGPSRATRGPAPAAGIPASSAPGRGTEEED